MKMFVYALLAGAMPFLCPIGSARADSVVEENAASAVFRAMRDDLERCFVSVTGNAFVMVEAVLDDRGRVRRASASGSSIRRWSVSGAGTRRTKTTAVSPSGFGAHVGTNGRVSFAARRSARVRIAEVGDAEIVTVRQTGIATGRDSGGPLLSQNELVGVVRGSAGPVSRDGPYERSREAYERIDLHRRWIAEEIAAWRSDRATTG